jgi:hypothetical protein
MRKFVVAFLATVLVGWLFYSFLQPRKAEEIIPLDPLEERATKDDADAVRALRQRYLANQQRELADYWLYKGALIGDPVLVHEYEIKFRGLTENEKRAQLQSIKTSSATTGQKETLLKRLTAKNAKVPDSN